MNYGKAVCFGCVIGLSSLQMAQAQVVVSGDISASGGFSDINNTDDSENKGGINTGLIGGNVKAVMNGWSGALDFNLMRRDHEGSDFDQFAPWGVGSMGVHFGREFGGNYIGAFYGINRFQGADSSSGNGYMSDDLYGIEGEAALGELVVLYGQYGHAHMVGDGTDTAFIGNYYRLGIAVQVNARMSVALEGEQGRSSNVFEDDGDWGEYRVFKLSGEYQFHPHLIGTLAISQMDITANDEDSGHDNSVMVGLRIPFGAAHRKSNLTTSYNPGLAAAWAESLD